MLGGADLPERARATDAQEYQWHASHCTAAGDGTRRGGRRSEAVSPGIIFVFKPHFFFH